MIRGHILSVGASLPPQIVTNAELSEKMDTSDEWIQSRSGITQRHIADADLLTSDLAAQAAQKALDRAGLTAADIDLVLVATTTPDETFPATATIVQRKLGCSGMAMDVQAVCSGFVYGLTTADGLFKTGAATRALVIGAETFSRLLDWEDRTTAVLFGDGAGAVVFEAQDTAEDTGFLSTSLHSDGQHHDLLYTTGGPSSTGTVGKVRMVGREVFRHAVENMADAMLKALDKAGYSITDVDWVVPHQANKRIIDSVGKKLKLDPNRVVITVDKHANTSAASIPLAFNEAVEDGRIKPGDLVLMEAMGGGLTWGACLVRV